VVGNIGKYVSSLSWHAGIITKLYNKRVPSPFIRFNIPLLRPGFMITMRLMSVKL
jgi:hypothetical protein